MALVNCVDCGKEISDKAAQCIHCGCPLETESTQNVYSIPTLAPDLSIGFVPEYDGWSQAVFNCHIAFDDVEKGTFNEAQFFLYPKGILIKLSGSMIQVHYSQIVNANITNKDSMHQQEKSPIARGIVGTLVLGGAGAVIGAVSGLKKKNRHYDSVLEIVFYKPQAKSFSTYFIAFNANKASNIPNKLIKRVMKSNESSPESEADGFEDSVEKKNERKFYEKIQQTSLSDNDYAWKNESDSVKQKKPDVKPTNSDKAQASEPNKSTQNADFEQAIKNLMQSGFNRFNALTKKKKYLFGALLLGLFMSYFVLRNAPEDSLTLSLGDLCRANVSAVYGRPFDSIKAEYIGNQEFKMTWTRASDYSKWSIICWKVGDNQLMWRTYDDKTGKKGRIRNGKYDEKVFFLVKGDNVYIEQIYSDGSKTRDSFPISVFN